MPDDVTQRRTQTDWTNAETLENRWRLGTGRRESPKEKAPRKTRQKVQKEVRPRGQPRKIEAAIEASRLRAEGWTLKRIGDKLGVSRQRVHQILARGPPRQSLPILISIPPDSEVVVGCDNAAMWKSLKMYVASLGYWLYFLIPAEGSSILGMFNVFDSRIPQWAWVTLFVVASLVAPFIAFHRLRMQYGVHDDPSLTEHQIDVLRTIKSPPSRTREHWVTYEGGCCLIDGIIVVDSSGKPYDDDITKSQITYLYMQRIIEFVYEGKHKRSFMLTPLGCHLIKNLALR